MSLSKHERRIRGKHRFLGALSFLIIGAAMAVSPAASGGPGPGDLSEGLRAYDAGDYAATVREWRPLAEAGDADAQAALAGLYMDGLGVGRSAAEAAAWYRRSARQCHLIAQINLGEMYALGRGVARDPVVAWAWLEVAAGRGSRWAARRRDALAGGMSAAAIAEARRRAGPLRRRC